MGQSSILIVDDDPNQIKILTAGLKAAGYRVLVASDGLQAVVTARRERPSLILLDLGLPGGDGFSVLHRLKAMTNILSNIPVIVLSARDADSNRQEALRAGAETFVQKPADLPTLLALIRTTLGEPEFKPAS